VWVASPGGNFMKLFARTLRRHFVRVVAVSLLLGVLTTVAVTWGLVAFLNTKGAKLSSADRVAAAAGGGNALYMVFRTDRRGYLAVSPQIPMMDEHGNFIVGESRPRIEDIVPRWAEAQVKGYWDSPFSGHGLVIESFGWPRVAAFSEVEVTYGKPPIVSIRRGTGIFVTGVHRTPSFTVASFPVVLPLRPIWRGIILDSAVFSALWSLMLICPGIIRQTIRVRRGLCRRCGYDLRGQVGEGCPECGLGRVASDAVPSPLRGSGD
jgi:hypothetical protein